MDIQQLRDQLIHKHNQQIGIFYWPKTSLLKDGCIISEFKEHLGCFFCARPRDRVVTIWRYAPNLHEAVIDKFPRGGLKQCIGVDALLTQRCARQDLYDLQVTSNT